MKDQLLHEAIVGRKVIELIREWKKRHPKVVKELAEAFKTKKPLRFLAWFYKFYQVPMYLKALDGVGSLVLAALDLDFKRKGKNLKEAGIETVRQGILIFLTVVFVGVSGSWVVAGFGWAFQKLRLMRPEHVKAVFAFLKLDNSELDPLKDFIVSFKNKSKGVLTGAFKSVADLFSFKGIKRDKDRVVPVGSYQDILRDYGLDNEEIFPQERGRLSHDVFSRKKIKKYRRLPTMRSYEELEQGIIARLEEEGLEVEQSEDPGATTLGLNWSQKSISYFIGLVKSKGYDDVIDALNAARIYYSNRSPYIVKKIFKIQKAIKGMREEEEWDFDDDEDMLDEVQVGSGLAYMRRKMRERRMKNPKLQKAAMKRWQKHGAKYIASFHKARKSGRGRAIARSLSKFLKKHTKHSRRECVEEVQGLFENLSKISPEAEMFRAFIPELIETDEFFSDMLLIFCEHDSIDKEINTYLGFVFSYFKENEVVPEELLEKSLWEDLKLDWRVTQDLFEATDDEGTNWAGNPEVFPPTNRNPIVPFPVGSSPDTNPKDYIEIYGNSWDDSKCHTCNRSYVYSLKNDDPGYCGRHGGVDVFEKPPVPDPHFPYKTMAAKNALGEE